ncbi:MAG: hypothetical protein ABID38_03565 [Candidatus Diapherotrites archaeon]
MKKFFAVFIFIILACSFVFAGIGSPKIWGDGKNKEGIIYIGTDNFASMAAKGSDVVGGCGFKIYAAEGTTPLIPTATGIVSGDVCTAAAVDVSSLDEGVYRLEVEAGSPTVAEDSYFAVVKIMTQPIPEILPVFIILIVVVVAFIVVRKGKK